ncbi:hypothetical protein PM082_004589 [Marasmius tenuissimus]|nr:hypothetical protein PM082_004589 [Marasmius tenuissimus]
MLESPSHNSGRWGGRVEERVAVLQVFTTIGKTIIKIFSAYFWPIEALAGVSKTRWRRAKSEVSKHWVIF